MRVRNKAQPALFFNVVEINEGITVFRCNGPGNIECETMPFSMRHLFPDKDQEVFVPALPATVKVAECVVIGDNDVIEPGSLCIVHYFMKVAGTIGTFCMYMYSAAICV